MKNKSDTFATYHPVVSFFYFSIVIATSMMIMHPVLLILSFAGALSYHAYQSDVRRAVLGIVGTIPMILISAVFNALFSHQGMTLLFYLKNGNPITLESILYGITTGFMLTTVILWFACFNHVMTSDKLIYLFGKLIPAMSLILTMIFRFVPRFIMQAKKVSNAQKGLGRKEKSSIYERVRQGIKILSILVTWELEHGIDTADSMKSRGFGLRGRTNYSRFCMDGRDICFLSAILFCFICLLYSILTKQIKVLFYPMIQINQTTGLTMVTYVIFTITCFLPMMINWVEDMKWNYLKSKI